MSAPPAPPLVAVPTDAEARSRRERFGFDLGMLCRGLGGEVPGLPAALERLCAAGPRARAAS